MPARNIRWGLSPNAKSVERLDDDAGDVVEVESA
jgi:hypothetical protein